MALQLRSVDGRPNQVVEALANLLKQSATRDGLDTSHPTRIVVRVGLESPERGLTA